MQPKHLPYNPLTLLEYTMYDREQIPPGQLPRDVRHHEEAGLLILANAINHLQGKAPDFAPAVAIAIQKGLAR